MSEAAQPRGAGGLGIEGEQLGRQPGLADEGDDGAVGGHRGCVDPAPSGDRPAQAAVLDRHRGQMNPAVILEQDVEAASVGRKMRLVDLPVEGLRGEKHGLVLTDTDERELRLQVGRGNVGPGRRDVGEPLAVGVPDWLVVGPGVFGDPDRLLLPVGEVRLHQPDVGVVVGVGLFGAVADEGDHAPIRRPGWIGVVVVPGGDLHDGLGLDVEDVEMGAQTIQITHIVFLELQPVDHPGPGRLFLARLRIADHEDESLPVGRPLVGLDALFDTGERDALPAA